jgi:large repetitive protein
MTGAVFRRLGWAALLSAAAMGCTFHPDYARYPSCGAGGSCPAGSSCWGEQNRCLPFCGEDSACLENATPRLVTTALPDAVADVFYTHTFSVSGGIPPYSFSLDPAGPISGLTLDTQGVLTGIPAAIGTYSLRVLVRDSMDPAAKDEALFDLKVRSLLKVATATPLTDAVAGQNYAEALQATGGAGSRLWSLATGSVLPSGLTLDASGALVGTPGDLGLAAFRIVVLDQSAPSQRAEKDVELNVRTAPLVLTVLTRAAAEGRVGETYSQNLVASGGVGALSWMVTSGILPDGIFLNPSGHFYGTPTTVGAWAVTVRVEDSGAQLASRNLTFDVR